MNVIMNVLPLAVNGHFESDTFPPYVEGVVARLTCKKGYLPKSHDTSRLESNNGILKWNPPSAQCVPFVDDPPVAYNGHFTNSGPFVEGSVATIQCDPGHTVTSNTSLLRDNNNVLEWDPPSLTCAPVNDLPRAVHGTFESDSPPPYVEGSVAKLTCNDGYIHGRIATSTLVSTTDGRLEWNPPYAECFRYVDYLPTAVDGTFNVYASVHDPSLNRYVAGDVAGLVCRDGYRSDAVFSTLGIDDGKMKWDPPSVACQPVSCPQPPQIDHGKTDHFDYTFPNTVEYLCEEGYRLNAHLSRYSCAPSGTWQPPIPAGLACLPVQCPELQAPENGTFSLRGERTFGHVAKFSCEPGYELVGGAAERECLSDGTWSGTDVRCEPRFVYCHPTPEMLRYPFKKQTLTQVVLDCGNGDEEVVLCERGEWSRDPPYCAGGVLPLRNPLNPDEHVALVPLNAPPKKRVKYRPVPPVQQQPVVESNVFWTLVICFVALVGMGLVLWPKKRVLLKS